MNKLSTRIFNILLYLSRKVSGTNLEEFGFLLSRTSNKILSAYSWKELEARKENVSLFLHETLPALNTSFAELTIMEGDLKINYGEIMGKLPEYDFVMPEVPLYLCVRGPASASWEVAQTYGITRSEWEDEQGYLDGMVTLNQRVRDDKRKAHLVIFRWEDPVNHLSLLKIFEAIK